MGGSGHLTLRGQHGEKRRHLGPAHVARVAATVPRDEVAHPVDVDLFGSQREAQIPRTLLDAVQQPPRLQCRLLAAQRGVGFAGVDMTGIGICNLSKTRQH